MIKISPSILSADFGNMERDIHGLQAAGAEYAHVDIMDGLFVPNLSMGFPMVSALRKVTDMVLDVHPMPAPISSPSTWKPTRKKTPARLWK